MDWRMLVKHSGSKSDEGNVGSHSEANNVELSVTPNSCNREVRVSWCIPLCLTVSFD